MTGHSKKLADMEQLRERIRATGLRCTSSRLAVLTELIAADSPLTHAEVAEKLSDRGMDKATVFRNLVDLVDVEILSRNELGDRVWRFEVRQPGAHSGEQHPHFVCVDCGGVTCLSDIEFNNSSRKATAEVGRVKEILLKGVCKSCD